MRSKERIQLTKWEWFHHYYIFFHAAIVVVFIGIPIYGYVKHNVINLPKDFYEFCLFWFVVAVFSYWWNWRNLFFEEYRLKVSNKKLEKAVNVTAQELGWEFYKGDENFYEGIRHLSFYGRTRITMKKTDNKVLINSIRNPEQRNGAMPKHNRENINAFLTNLSNIHQEKNVAKTIKDRQLEKEVAFWNESEWSIKMILMRIVGYGFILFFLLLGLVSFLCENGFLGFMLGVISFLICFGFGYDYIKNDIEILREKSRRKRTTLKRPYKKREKY